MSDRNFGELFPVHDPDDAGQVVEIAAHAMTAEQVLESFQVLDGNISALVAKVHEVIAHPDGVAFFKWAGFDTLTQLGALVSELHAAEGKRIALLGLLIRRLAPEWNSPANCYMGLEMAIKQFWR